MLSKRIIACLDVRDGSVVKGVQFEGLRDAGDPRALAKRYNVEGIDELVILDVTATLEGRRALAQTIRDVARELFIPLAVGGGILVGTLFMTLVALSAAEMCSLHQMQSYYYYDQPRKDCFNERRYLSVAGTAVAVGGGMALGGGLWLGDRAAKRKPIKAELEARHPELSWRLDVRPARGGSTLGVQLTF